MAPKFVIWLTLLSPAWPLTASYWDCPHGQVLVDNPDGRVCVPEHSYRKAQTPTYRRDESWGFSEPEPVPNYSWKPSREPDRVTDQPQPFGFDRTGYSDSFQTRSLAAFSQKKNKTITDSKRLVNLIFTQY